VQAGYARSKIKGTVGQPNFLGQRVTSDVSYDSTNAYVQLQQPLLNYNRYAQYQRGAALAAQGVATFAVREQETGIRVARAYFNALLAYDNLALQRSLTESLAGQVKGLEARFESDEGTKTDVQETRARLAVARADIIEAEDDLQVALRELEAVLGAAPQRLAAMGERFPLLPLSPAGLEDWRERARFNNAEVRAAREAVNVAEAEVERARSQYFPTMDLVASVGKADSENLSTLSQRSNTFVIGVQVNIPIFTGGYTSANVSRARLELRTLQQELNAVMERVDAEVTRQYTNVEGGADRIRALEVAVESSHLTLDSARKSFEYGLFSNLDVLKAQDTLYQARFQLVSARLEYLLARFQLATAAGDLHSGQFDVLNDAYLGRVITAKNPD
jgi:protease secretion system outer membrane protein